MNVIDRHQTKVQAGLAILLLFFAAGVARADNFVEARHPTQTRYLVFDLPTLGGTHGAGIGINNLGWITGHSTLPDDQIQHAALWLWGWKLDLGTLGGSDASSAVLWPAKNHRGLIVGVSQTDELDQLEENWSCSFFLPAAGAENTCLGFAWEWGEMRPLPPFPGGNNSFATGANNQGEIVGWAENGIHDPTCVPPQVLQFRAAVWGPGEDQRRELPPYPGDTVSAATAINDRGQVVGISGICDIAVGRFSARHAVLWENGRVIDLGNLGGVAWHTPMAINDQGTVVGFSNVDPADGGTANFQAFIWREARGMKRLGTLQGDTNSQALGINNRGQVVGGSSGPDGRSAFLWQNGRMVDLNSLVLWNYDGHLLYASDINDFGVITGEAEDPDTGETHAFQAIPIRAWAF